MSVNPEDIFAIVGPAMEREINQMLDSIGHDDLTALEKVALVAFLRPVYERIQEQERPLPSPLKLVRKELRKKG